MPPTLPTVDSNEGLTDKESPSTPKQTDDSKSTDTGTRRTSTRASAAEKKVRFSESDEVFRPSYETFTPSVNDHRIEYRTPDQRVPAAVAPPSSVSRPNYDDALRRVAIVAHSHIQKCEDRLKELTPDGQEQGLFHMSKLRLFSEGHFVLPQYVYYLPQVPVLRMGMCFGIRKLSKQYTLPSVEEIYSFIRTLFTSAQLSSECSIVCLIYVERLMEHANVPLVSETWRPIVLCGLLLASKVWQDLSSWNIEFSNVYPQFSLQNINKLERLFCHHVKWDLYISSSLYAKYYFALRSLTEKKDFRRHYNITMRVNPPKAQQIQERSESVKQNLSNILSKSL